MQLVAAAAASVTGAAARKPRQSASARFALPIAVRASQSSSHHAHETKAKMMRQRVDDGCDEKAGYPFARVLRLRVVQVVCGISTLVMGAVALIEEKSPFNLGLGVPAGVSTVLAAANNIYSSRGFDGYQPSTCKESSIWLRFRILGPTFKLAIINILLWSLVTFLLLALTAKAVQVLHTGSESVTINAIAGTELFLCICVSITVIAITWVDCKYDPDWQEPGDLAHSNTTATAVSMVTLSASV